MDLVSERVSAGVPDQEIVDELLGSYTGAVLLDPPASGATLVLWLAPLAVLGLGIAVILGGGAIRHRLTPRNRLLPGETGPDWWSVAWSWPWPSQDRRGRRQLTTGSAGLGRRGGSHRRAGLVRCEQRDHGGRNRRQRRRSTGQRDASRSGGALLRRATTARLSPTISSWPKTRTPAATRPSRRWYVSAGWHTPAMARWRPPPVSSTRPLPSTPNRRLPGTCGRVVWCGTGETEQAIETFDDLLADPALAAETQAQIESISKWLGMGVNARDGESLALDRSGHRGCHGGPGRGPGQPFRKRSRPGRLPVDRKAGTGVHIGRPRRFGRRLPLRSARRHRRGQLLRPWCLECRNEHDDLVAASESFADQDVTFVQVAYQEEAAESLDYLGEAGASETTLYLADPGAGPPSPTASSGFPRPSSSTRTGPWWERSSARPML